MGSSYPHFEAIIAGGSFAGLSAARQLKGKRVLLVEPHDIGMVQTSACGTLLAVLEATGTSDSLLQTHDHIVFHLRKRTIDFPLHYHFCTFDYHTFCKCLLSQSDVEILKAQVTRRTGHTIHTTEGSFESECLIDATGWKARLAASPRKKIGTPRGMSFGLETSLPLEKDGLHLYYDPRRFHPHNIGWLFPAGQWARAGIASYRGYTKLRDDLSSFLRQAFEQSMDGQHGGYFPHRRMPAITGPVFRAGDSAGQCIPFTGEGIRPALYFGAAAGRLVRSVLEGELSEREALQRYQAFVDHHKAVYRILLAGQKVVPRLPLRPVEEIAYHIQRPDWLVTVLDAYWAAVDPTQIAKSNVLG
jgi:flavin-dependent dehydrogenase